MNLHTKMDLTVKSNLVGLFCEMTILILYFWGNLPTKMYEIVKLVGLLTEIELQRARINLLH